MAGEMAEPDKQQLYGDFRDAAKVREKLYMRAAHKALDIPEDDMQINANRTGIGTLGAIGIAAAAALAPTALVSWMLLKSVDDVAKSIAPPAATAPQHWDAIYEEQQPDGSWKVIRRDRLK